MTWQIQFRLKILREEGGDSDGYTRSYCFTYFMYCLY